MARTLKELIEASVSESEIEVSQERIARALKYVDSMRQTIKRKFNIELEQLEEPTVKVQDATEGKGYLNLSWRDDETTSVNVSVSLEVYDTSSDYELKLCTNGEIN